MPHQCTSCGRVFADGSKEMLSGCPDCGGNKFQFRPRGSVGSDASTAGSEGVSPDRDSGGGVSPGPAGGRSGATPQSKAGSAGTGRARAARDATGSTSAPTAAEEPGTARQRVPTDGDIVVADDDPAAGEDAEDRAQASARSDVVTPRELEAVSASESADGPPNADGRVIEPSGRERPSLDELREELNDQFESIKVINRGQYELNLMELYDRDEYIISLQEDGRYVIEVPDSWRSNDDG